MKKNILFIDSWNNVGDFFRTERNKITGVKNVSLYKNDSLHNKILRWIGVKIFKPIMFFAYGDWKKEIDRYDIFIVESRKTFEYAIKYIRKKTEKRIIVWYWNEVTERELVPNEVKEKYNCEVWSFDKKNSEKYGMKYNDTYYFSTVELSEKNKKNDVFYVGIDREGRIERLQELSEQLEKCGLSYNFNLTISPIKQADKNYNYKSRMEYTEVLKEIAQSRVILDLTKETQYGLTLRPVEAMFFKKKLITDNRNIINYEFYDSNNIFIIGKDDYKNLNNFVTSEYKEINQEIIDKYDFKNWLERIIYEGEKN